MEEVIMECLMGGLGRDWLSAFGEFTKDLNDHHHHHHFYPFLLISPPSQGEGEVDSQHRALYNLSKDRVYDFRLQLPHNKICRGSSFGWLVTMERTPPEAQAWHQCHVQLHNPFLNRTIDLPSLDNIARQYPDDRGWDNKKFYIRKAVLSRDPLSSPDDFLVLAIMSSYRGLAFFKSGDTTWTSIGEDWRRDCQRDELGYYWDVVFSHNTNRFYALLNCGAVFEVDFSDAVPKLTLFANPLMSDWGSASLVEDASGDFFLIYKRVEPKVLHPLHRSLLKDLRGLLQRLRDRSAESLTAVFSLFKLNRVSRNWIKIDSIGDNVMFLGLNASSIRPSSACPGCRPNSIYFTDTEDCSFGPGYNHHGLPFDGFYSLKDRTVQPHYESAGSNEACPRAIWIEPTLETFRHAISNCRL